MCTSDRLSCSSPHSAGSYQSICLSLSWEEKVGSYQLVLSFDEVEKDLWQIL
jgi:hypothetical protein